MYLLYIQMKPSDRTYTFWCRFRFGLVHTSVHSNFHHSTGFWFHRNRRFLAQPDTAQSALQVNQIANYKTINYRPYQQQIYTDIRHHSSNIIEQRVYRNFVLN